MALTFPTNPVPGDQYLSYIWDGVKWGVMAGVGGVAGVSSLNTRTGSLTLLLADVTGATGSGSTAQASLGLATVAASGAYADLSGAPSLAPYAPLAAPVFTGDARAVTPAVGDNDTSIATTAFVQTATGAALTHANLLHNAGFAINQRAYASGGALAAGAYGFDRWKAGASGCTLTFAASPPSTTITITAGSLQQVVEGAGIRGGSHTLSWTGTAQGKVGAGSYAASPVTASLTAGSNATLEFNAGTLSGVKLEEGSTATPLERTDPQQDLAKCQRFYQTASLRFVGYQAAGAGFGAAQSLMTTMRAVPTVVPTYTTQTNCTGGILALDAATFSVNAIATALGVVVLTGTCTASADL